MKCFWSVVIIGLVFAGAAVSRADGDDGWWMDGLRPFPRDAFISPDVCARCHDEIAGMWEGSLHASAIDDPLFLAASKSFAAKATLPGERADAEHCVACHTPIAYRSGEISGVSDDFAKIGEVGARGVSCDFCHSVTDAARIMNASLNAEPGRGEDDPGTKRGPRDDAEAPYHETAFSALHTSAEFCGACHNVTHLWYYTKLEGTYDEWFASPYHTAETETTVVCQDCHMRQSPGVPATGMTERPDYPGASSPMGMDRPHVYQHSVVGANTFMPRLLGSPEKADMAAERLASAAVLTVTPLKQDGGHAGFTVRVTNAGAGHMLPTGVTEFRQIWLEVTATDARGTVVYASGGLAPDASLAAGTRSYGTVFGTVDGTSTVNVTEAALMLSDRRIPPKGYIDETFMVPASVKGALTVKASLKYRSMDPGLVALLLAERHDVPVVTMATVERTLP